jgi:hypothetical protein
MKPICVIYSSIFVGIFVGNTIIAHKNIQRINKIKYEYDAIIKRNNKN